MGLLYCELGWVEVLVEDIFLVSFDSCVLQGESLLCDGVVLVVLVECKCVVWNEYVECLVCLVLDIFKFWYGLQKCFKGKVELVMIVLLNDVKG